jgi:hypothetical protein
MVRDPSNRETVISLTQEMQRGKTDPVIGGKHYQIHRGIIRILRLRDEVSDSPASPEAMVEEIRQEKILVDLFTFLQRPPNTSPKFSYYMEWDNLAIVEVSSYENWYKKQIPKSTRVMIRKAAVKGLVVRVESFSDELAIGLVGLFNETPIRRGKRYPYYGWDCGMVKRAWATQLDQSLWVVAYYREVLVGFIKLIVSDGIARASGTIAKEAHRDKAPMNALLAECVRLCGSMGIPLLMYGKFTYGGVGETSLTDFKRHNGFRKLDVPRYYVPLSVRGRIGLRLGLHRSLIDVIPGPVLRALLQLRAKWYEMGRRDE